MKHGLILLIVWLTVWLTATELQASGSGDKTQRNTGYQNHTQKTIRPDSIRGEKNRQTDARMLDYTTGSIEIIDMRELQDLPVGSLGQALAGRINGLNINGGDARPGIMPSITIRHPLLSSLYGKGGSPIFVIDDFIMDEDQFNNLNPAEVESITILKDAAAAIYGVRASQGAIVVKTKRGGEKGFHVSYNGSVGVSDHVVKPKVLDAYQYGLYLNK